MSVSDSRREDGKVSVEELSQRLDVSANTVRRWLKQGKLVGTKAGGRWEMSVEDNSHFVTDFFRRKFSRPLLPDIPSEIGNYHKWHQVLDELSWLIKVCYGERGSVRSKQFRLEQLFGSYLVDNNVRLGKVHHELSSNSGGTKDTVAADLRRGWYNELAFLTPLKPSTLGLSYSDLEINIDSSDQRFTFPSWRIAQAYYAVYHYLRAITSIKFAGFRYEEHNASISAFKKSAFDPLRRSIWYFPLDIAYLPGQRRRSKRSLLRKFPHLRFKYCNHPRAPHGAPVELFANVHDFYRGQAKRNRANAGFAIVDFLRDFRIWANYQDVDDLLSLHGRGYKAYLDQGLSVLLFFVGGISEICFVARYGQDEYVNLLSRFYDACGRTNERLASSLPNTAPYQRMQIYHHLKYVEQRISLREPEDRNALIVLRDN